MQGAGARADPDEGVLRQEVVAELLLHFLCELLQ